MIVVFDSPDKKNRWAGKIVSGVYIGRTKRGNIPNFKLTVKGRSGKELAVDLVEDHCQQYESWDKAKPHLR